MAKLKKILIMAGGTGGHVFPGLAVAVQLREQGVEVHWLGTQNGFEARVVPQEGIPLHFITISGLRGKGLKDSLLMPIRLFKAIVQAIRVMKKIRPDVVLGMGGFVSGPGGIASWLLRIPLVIHEQNAKAGMTNKWLAKVATTVLEGFPNTFSNVMNVFFTGNPVRDAIANIPVPEGHFQEKSEALRLLVVGGSLGAAVINQLIPRTLSKMPAEERPVVYHQTGEKNLQATLEAYQSANVKAEVVPFIEDMANAYSWADIVLCRAGALTIAELCAAGRGAILVPYPHAVDDHQTKNANYLVANKAAILIQQKDLTEDVLISIFKQQALVNNCLAMANAAYSLRKVDATRNVLKFCEEAAL
ncbi:MAG: undecaprenyldiphospho-muramoylpentapeptide beta-N-acetylglucosaminyltransferase [Gammaproteobacteria bacterium]|nr:undecaprenyldiphospho-muramoylpentapeptide beta-N-acetylglucosaminyltransferase [Gammaproteobacteria bacterium]